MTVTRRTFVKGMGAGAALAGLGPALSLDAGQAEASTTQPAPQGSPPAPPKGKRPNILVILCDQMRYPPVYESEAMQAFRRESLPAQQFLRTNGLSLERHYAASAACVPSRASLITGHYPSLHGTSQTTGAAKEPFDPEVFWLDPDAVPTFGDYFRAAGYRTYWKGKWHASAADLYVPGTHTPIPSYDASVTPIPTSKHSTWRPTGLTPSASPVGSDPSPTAARSSTADRPCPRASTAATKALPGRPST